MKTIIQHNSPVSPLELSELMIHSPAAPDLDPTSNLETATGRELLRLALNRKHQTGPIALPQEYARFLCGDDAIGRATKGELFMGKDEILNQSFSVVATDDAQTIIDSYYLDHANMQRLYGFCHLDNSNISLLILEYLPKGTVDEFLRTSHGRLQLHAQRRIQIMLDAARILHKQKAPLDFTSGNIGLNLHLATKVCVPSEIPKDDVSPTVSFGILMMELLTGALQNDEKRQLGDFCERYAKGSEKFIEDDLDPYVRESWTFNILSQLIELALGCIEEDVEKRPSTEKLLDTLTLIESRMNAVTSCYDY
mmetsp:Transcript_18009/g.26650  ORF Transcript_18009/g.26650 Transcript_18009/m.26650 type:complete len:309 (+) Transcript_18009:84-1010(+)